MKKLMSTLLAMIMIIGVIPIKDLYANSEIAKVEYIELLDDFINAETQYGLSGVQLAVYKDGKLLKNSAYGYINNYKNVERDGKIVLGEHEVLPEN